MKKAFDQTVRDLKREVNKKVLKVPSIEQKVLDATSNEPWGPHGSLLADIAHSTKNYHEYQMVMAVIWKRINDTGKNWRHVYKGLTVLEYLVAHGSERIIDDIREHAYQISTLSDFQYIDSSGRDQGSNVRKKSQSLVVLVNDKERIQEVRQKAAANRDKFRNTSTGGMYRPGSYSGPGGYGDRFDEDRYGGRDEERNGYGKEREWGNRDEDKYGRYGDSYSRDGDRYGRDNDERSRDGYKDDDYRGRSRSVDDYNYGSRSRSSDRDGGHAYDDDGQYSSRGSGARADDRSQDGSVTGRPLERRFSEQNLSVPPSYEEAVGASRSPTLSERDVEAPSKSYGSSSPSRATVPPPAPAAASPQSPAPAYASPPENKDIASFDEFDPRASFSAVPAPSNGAIPTTSSGTEMDFLGSLSDSLALVPVDFSTSEGHPSGTTGSGSMFGRASSISNQMFEDPFGDGPFNAIPTSQSVQTQQQNITPSFLPNSNQSPELPEPVPRDVATCTASYGSNGHLTPTNMQYAHQELSTSNQEIDILADIFPPSGPSPPQHTPSDHSVPSGQPSLQAGFQSQDGPTTQLAGYVAPPGQASSLTGFAAQPGQQSPQTSLPMQGRPVSSVGFSDQTSNFPSSEGFPAQPGQAPQAGFGPQSGQPASLTGFPSATGYFPQSGFQVSAGHSLQSNAAHIGGYNTGLRSTGPVGPQMGQTSAGPSFLPQPTAASHIPSQMPLQYSQIQRSNALVLTQASPVSTALVSNTQPAKDKFESKSAIWADTLSRGLVNLNISGPKTNPLADIGVDFDSINRKEKRMEKPSTAPVTSTVTMGKAMGAGSGIGRAAVGAPRPHSNPMVRSGMGMGMGTAGPGAGAGMVGYGGVNQPSGMGMGMNRPMNMGMGMNMGQRVQMQQPTGFPPGSSMSGGYNPNISTGTYGYPPYGRGY